MNTRRFFLGIAAGLLTLPFGSRTAFARRRRKGKGPVEKSAPTDYSTSPMTATERQQVLRSFPTSRIEAALDLHFLMSNWSVLELYAEMQRRKGGE